MELIALYSHNWNNMPIIIFIYSLFILSLVYMTESFEDEKNHIDCFVEFCGDRFTPPHAANDAISHLIVKFDLKTQSC